MSVFKPKSPKVPTPEAPPQPQLEDTARAADQAVERGRQRRGYAAQLLTGDQGLSNLGPVGTRALLGRVA